MPSLLRSQPTSNAVGGDSAPVTIADFGVLESESNAAATSARQLVVRAHDRSVSPGA